MFWSRFGKMRISALPRAAAGQSHAVPGGRPSAEQPLPQNVRRLEHEYSLAAAPAFQVGGQAHGATRHEGRTILVLADPGGEPLDRFWGPVSRARTSHLIRPDSCGSQSAWRRRSAMPMSAV